MSELQEGRARCHCGRIELAATFPSRFCCHCHCESCRRSHSAAFVTWIGFRAEQVRIAQGEEFIAAYESSPGTLRKFCRVCGARISFQSQRWAGEIHIPLAAFVTPVDRAPDGHVFAEEQVAWLPFHAHE